MRSYFWFNFVDAGIVFILLTLSLSHFLLWIGRKRVITEKGNLYFSLATLSLALFCFQRSLWPGLLIAHRGLHQHFNPTIEGLLFLACFVGITRYLKHLTNWYVNPRYLAVLTWLAAYSSRMAIRPGISVSAMRISLRPQSARPRSAMA